MTARELRQLGIAGVLMAASVTGAQPPQLTNNSSGAEILAAATALAEACDRDTAALTLYKMAYTLSQADQKPQAEDLLKRARAVLDKETDPTARAEGYLTLVERLASDLPGGATRLLPEAAKLIEALPSDAPARAKLLAQLAGIQFAHGETDAAARNLKAASQAALAMSADKPDVRIEALLTVIETRLLEGDQPLGDAQAEIDALRGLLAKAQPEQRTLAELRLTELLVLSRADAKLVDQACDRLRQTVPTAERNSLLPRLVIAAAMSGGRVDEVRRLAGLADSPTVKGELLLAAADQLWQSKEAKQAETLFAEAEKLLAEGGNKPLSLTAEFHRISGLVRIGKTDAALKIADGADPGRTPDAARMAGERRGHLCEALLAVGRLDEARRYASGLPSQQRRMLLAVASAHLKKGEAKPATELLAEVAKLEQERAMEVDVVDPVGNLKPAVMAELAAVLAEKSVDDDLGPAKKQLAAAWREARGRTPPGFFGDRLRAALALEMARVVVVLPR